MRHLSVATDMLPLKGQGELRQHALAADVLPDGARKVRPFSSSDSTMEFSLLRSSNMSVARTQTM